MPAIPAPAACCGGSFDLPTLHVGSTVTLDREARVMRCAPANSLACAVQIYIHIPLHMEEVCKLHTFRDLKRCSRLPADWRSKRNRAAR